MINIKLKESLSSKIMDTPRWQTLLSLAPFVENDKEVFLKGTSNNCHSEAPFAALKGKLRPEESASVHSESRFFASLSTNYVQGPCAVSHRNSRLRMTIIRGTLKRNLSGGIKH